MPAAYGSFSALEISDVRYDFAPSSVLGKKTEYLDSNGLRGVLDHSIERNTNNIYRVNGQIRMFPTPVELRTLLPIIMGAAETGAGPYAYAFGQSLTGTTIVVDRVTKVHTYAGALCDSFRIHGAQGSEAIGIDMDWVGTTESEGNAGSFSSTAIDITTKPWYFAQSALTIGGTTYTPQSWEISVNHNVDRDRFFNSETLSTGTNATDRNVNFSCTLPYGDSAAVYTTHSASTGVAVVVTLTNGVYILTITLVKVALAHMAPEINSRGEIMLRASGQAMKSSSTLPMTISLAVS